jgi:hypothetical protein
MESEILAKGSESCLMNKQEGFAKQEDFANLLVSQKLTPARQPRQPRQPGNLPWKQQNNVLQQNIPEQKLPEQSDPTHSGRSMSSQAKVITLEWHTERNKLHESSWPGVLSAEEV